MSIDLLNYINTSDYGEWKRVKIPMKKFPIYSSNIDLKIIKSVVFSFSDDTKLKIDDINDIDLKSLEQTLDFSDNLNSSRVIPISDNDGFDISKKNPSKLKVDELRELVVNKNLKSNEEASKLKKGDLIKLLE